MFGPDSILVTAAFWSAIERGIVITISLTILSMLFGLIIAVPVAVIDLRGNRVASMFARAYVLVFRGVPLLMLLFLFYYGLPRVSFLRSTLFWDLIFVSPYRTALFVMSLNNSAYLAETVRGGLIGVNRGMVEAGRSVGMSDTKVFVRIEVPLAYRAILGNLGNETIAVMKASAITSAITVHDLMGGPTVVGKIYLDVFTPLLVVGLIYLTLVTIVDRGVAWLRVRAGLQSS